MQIAVKLEATWCTVFNLKLWMFFRWKYSCSETTSTWCTAIMVEDCMLPKLFKCRNWSLDSKVIMLIYSQSVAHKNGVIILFPLFGEGHVTLSFVISNSNFWTNVIVCFQLMLIFCFYFYWFRQVIISVRPAEIYHTAMRDCGLPNNKH